MPNFSIQNIVAERLKTEYIQFDLQNVQFNIVNNFIKKMPYPANMCNNCGFGNKKDNCCKCGNWMGSTKIPARICNDCGFGNKKDNCCRCGNWMGSTKIPANICNNCGFGNKKDNCCRCGKWAPY